MSETIIEVHNLSKTFRVAQREAGLKAALHALVKPAYTQVEAVKEVSFTLRPGEMVGLLGPNGAGKTTLLKMLAGLLYPTSGRAEVAGCTPWQRKAEYLRQIGMVLGNKSQMLWDIPPTETFRVLGEIYGVPVGQLKTSLDELYDLLDMRELLTRPVRTFSLGERMKCELVAGLLYQPRLLFLDEPTLGLDVSMQRRLRLFVAEVNRRMGVTVLLTSHYMADITALCPRVILIQEGRLLYDGELNGLAQRLAPYKLLRLTLGAEVDEADLQRLPEGAERVEGEGEQMTLRVRREGAAKLTAWLLEHLPVSDLSVEDPPVEAVMDRVYQGGAL